jgi:hypothetical protein
VVQKARYLLLRRDNVKQSRRFIVLTLLLILILVVGLAVITTQTRKDNDVKGDYFTATAILATNSALAENIILTKTVKP